MITFFVYFDWSAPLPGNVNPLTLVSFPMELAKGSKQQINKTGETGQPNPI